MAGWIYPATFFAILVVAISYRVLPNEGVLMYQDYPYYWPGQAYDGLSVVQSSFAGVIRLAGMFSAPLYLLPKALTTVLPDAVASYLLTYGVIYGCSVSYYFVASKLAGSTPIGFLAGTLIVLNSVVLEYLTIQPSSIFAALTVYVWTIYAFRCSKQFGWRQVCFLAMLSIALTHPFFWMLELILIVVLFVFLDSAARKMRYGIALGVLLPLVALYWLVPLVFETLRTTTEEIYAGNQTALFEGLKATVRYIEGFDLLEYPGTWQRAVFGGRVPHVFYFGVAAFILGVFTWVGRVGAKRRDFLALLVVYAVAFNAGLGPNSAFSGSLWQWLYGNVPGFGFFRSFARFFVLVLVATVLLVALSLRELRATSQHGFRLAYAAIALGVVVGHSSFFSGDMNGAAVATEVPSEYLKLNSFLRRVRTDYSVMTFPNVAYESYTWGANRNYAAFPQTYYFKEMFLARPVIFDRAAFNDLNIVNEYFPRLFASHSDFRFYSAFDEDLNKFDVRFVVVHKDLLDNLRVIGRLDLSSPAAERLARVPYSTYKRYFEKRKEYRRVLENGLFVVYENLSYRPRLRATDSVVQKLGESSYRVRLRNLLTPRSLSLLQRFDDGWELYPQAASQWTSCGGSKSQRGEVSECPNGNEGLVPPLSRLASRESFAAPHVTRYGYANGWSIDPAAFRRQFSDAYYRVNPDDSIDVEFLVRYRPQAVFDVSAMVTIFTLLSLVAWRIGVLHASAGLLGRSIGTLRARFRSRR